MRYVDTQVKYGQNYRYTIYAYTAVIGTKYRYQFTHDPPSVAGLASNLNASNILDRYAAWEETASAIAVYSAYNGETVSHSGGPVDVGIDWDDNKYNAWYGAFFDWEFNKEKFSPAAEGFGNFVESDIFPAEPIFYAGGQLEPPVRRMNSNIFTDAPSVVVPDYSSKYKKIPELRTPIEPVSYTHLTLPTTPSV